MTSGLILADIFLSEDAKKILQNKNVVFIGDSIVRGMYKDLVRILQTSTYLEDYHLMEKGEFRFQNDNLKEGGQMGEMSNSVNYREVREFENIDHFVRFYFITKCYSEYFMSICKEISNLPRKPDVIIMNSCLWDLTRYGEDSIHQYKHNLPKAFYELAFSIPKETLFLWTTTMPLGKVIKGGFLLPDLENCVSKLREDVVEANRYAWSIAKEFKLDCLDLHFHFRKQLHRRAIDGIHWDVTGHRRITNLILHHICEAWDIQIPGRILIRPYEQID